MDLVLCKVVIGPMVEALGFTRVCAMFKPLTLFPLVGPLRSTPPVFGKIEIFAMLLVTFYLIHIGICFKASYHT